MAAAITFKISGFKEMNQLLKRLPDKLQHKVRVQILKNALKKTIKDAKNLDMIKIGDYDISVQEIGTERTVYANDEIISKTKVSIF